MLVNTDLTKKSYSRKFTFIRLLSDFFSPISVIDPTKFPNSEIFRELNVFYLPYISVSVLVVVVSSFVVVAVSSFVVVIDSSVVIVVVDGVLSISQYSPTKPSLQKHCVLTKLSV